MRPRKEDGGHSNHRCAHFGVLKGTKRAVSGEAEGRRAKPTRRRRIAFSLSPLPPYRLISLGSKKDPEWSSGSNSSGKGERTERNASLDHMYD